MSEKEIKLMESDLYELTRLRYKYRELILKKKTKLPIQKASRLIGPDCAFHLYSDFSVSKGQNPAAAQT